MKDGRVAVNSLFALLGAALLALPAIASAHLPPMCPEWWNPPGVKIPPAGFTTAPGLNPHSGMNPDGFFKLLSSDGHPLVLRDGCPGIGGMDDGGTGLLFDTTFPSGTTIKYTEANGIKVPRFEPMAANKGGGNGRAVEVDFHLWGSGDLWICDAFDLTSCTCCRVPPPPK